MSADGSAERVGRDLFAFPFSHVLGNTGVVIGSRTSVIIDTGLKRDEMTVMVDYLQERGAKVDALVLTHGHLDHVLGGAFLAPATTYAHEFHSAQLEGVIGRASTDSNPTRAEILESVATPDVTFRDALVLETGSHALRLTHAPGHTPDSIVVQDLEEGVLFAGDTVVTAIPPFLGDGNSETLEASLRAILRIGPTSVVPGHGHILGTESEVTEWLGWMVDYLGEIRNRLLTLGAPPDHPELDELVPYDRLTQGRFADTRFDPERRHVDLVRIIAGELAPEPS